MSPHETRNGIHSMASSRKRQVIAGVDTHKATHHAAVVDTNGRILGDREFPNTSHGYQDLLDWLTSFGRLVKAGIEGTGSYGAGLTRHLAAAKITVIEVDRPDRKTRRKKGKSDPIDAINAARAVLSGEATGTPKTRTGPVESVRAIRTARNAAVADRTKATNQLHGLIASAPDTLREHLTGLRGNALVTACAALTADTSRIHDPDHATRYVLHRIAGRIQHLNTEIKDYDKQLTPLITTIAPRLCALYGVGPDVAGQLLTTAGDNPHRLRSEAALARLCGAAPIPASSGRTDRHRLHRGGDRQANKALYTITLTRQRGEQRTRDYIERRTKQGLTSKEIRRCLKRYIIREIYTALIADYENLTNPA